MADTPQKRDITIEFECQFRIKMESSDFLSIMKAFLMLLPHLLKDFFQKVLIGFGEYEMSRQRKAFACRCCGNDTEFVWKTRHGKPSITFPGNSILIPQVLQIAGMGWCYKFYR